VTLQGTGNTRCIWQTSDKNAPESNVSTREILYLG